MNASILPTPPRRDYGPIPTALLLTLDAAVADRVGAALAGLAQLHRADPIEDSALLTLAEVRPALCIVDAQDAGLGLAPLLAALRRAAPAASLVALGDEASADLILACLRAGALDFLDRQGGEVALRRALRARLDRGAREAIGDRQGPVFGLFGARPADPSRAHALAVATARLRAGRRVMFLDLAPGSRETEIALDITPAYGVKEALADLDRLDQALLSSAAPRHAAGGLSALLLGEELRAESLPGGDLATLLVVLRGVYDEVVVHAGLPLLAEAPMLLGGMRRFGVMVTQHLASAQAAADALRRLAQGGVAVDDRAVLLVAEHVSSVLPAPRTLAGAIGIKQVLPLPDQRARLCGAANQGRFVEEALADRAFARALAPVTAALGAEAEARAPLLRRLGLRR